MPGITGARTHSTARCLVAPRRHPGGQCGGACPGCRALASRACLHRSRDYVVAPTFRVRYPTHQRRYLLYYRELIRRLSGGEPQLSEAAKSELSTALQAFLPDAPLTWMIELGADAVAAELAAVRAAINGS